MKIILCSLLFWFYIDTRKLFENERIVNSGLIHSIISCIGYNAGLFFYPRIMYDYPAIRDSIPDIYLIVPFISFGYGFYDVYIGVKSRKLENMLHGVCLLSSFVCAYCYNITCLLHITMITETSSVFLNLRPLKQEWIDTTFVVTFFLYRLLFFPMLVFIYMMNPDNILKIYILAETMLITSLNVYWFRLIITKLLKNN